MAIFNNFKALPEAGNDLIVRRGFPLARKFISPEPEKHKIICMDNEERVRKWSFG